MKKNPATILPQNIRLNSHDTRKNLPRVSSAKRGESNFLREFETVYFNDDENKGKCFARGREFTLEGYGRADIIWLAWKNKTSGEKHFTGPLQNKMHIIAIEAKLKDWRKGLMQVARYRYFANKAILVLAPQASAVAVRHLDAFKKLSVGLWEFDPKSASIIKHTTPRKQKPLCALAQTRALKIITPCLKLG